MKTLLKFIPLACMASTLGPIAQADMSELIGHTPIKYLGKDPGNDPILQIDEKIVLPKFLRRECRWGFKHGGEHGYVCDSYTAVFDEGMGHLLAVLTKVLPR